MYLHIVYTWHYKNPENTNLVIFSNRRRRRRFLFRKYLFFLRSYGYNIVPCAALIRYLLPTCEKIIRLSGLVHTRAVSIYFHNPHVRLPTPYAQIQPPRRSVCYCKTENYYLFLTGGKSASSKQCVCVTTKYYCKLKKTAEYITISIGTI